MLPLPRSTHSPYTTLFRSIIASGRQIELEDLPDSISKIALQERDRIKVERAKAASEGRTTTFQITVPSSMEEIERQAIERSEEHTSELQSPCNLVCRLLLE